MEKESEKIKELAELMKDSSEFDVKSFSTILEQLSESKNPNIITGLLEIMQDDFDYPEVLYSVIHIIEKFEAIIYCEFLLKSLPSFILKSPEWASTVFGRIFNSENTLLCFIEIIKSQANDSQRERLKELISDINLDDNSFVEKTKPLLAVL